MNQNARHSNAEADDLDRRDQSAEDHRSACHDRNNFITPASTKLTPLAKRMTTAT